MPVAPLELTLISDSQSRSSRVHMDRLGLPITFSSVPVQRMWLHLFGDRWWAIGCRRCLAIGRRQSQRSAATRVFANPYLFHKILLCNLHGELVLFVRARHQRINRHRYRLHRVHFEMRVLSHYSDTGLPLLWPVCTEYTLGPLLGGATSPPTNLWTVRREWLRDARSDPLMPRLHLF
jgi:hypothetical protein